MMKIKIFVHFDAFLGKVLVVNINSKTALNITDLKNYMKYILIRHRWCKLTGDNLKKMYTRVNT